MKKARKVKRSDAPRKLTKDDLAALHVRLHATEMQLLESQRIADKVPVLRDRNFVLEKTLEQRDQALTEIRRLVASLKDVIDALVTRALEAKR